MTQKMHVSADKGRNKASHSSEYLRVQAGSSASYADLLNAMHLSYGNRTLQNMLDSGLIRPKLKIGAPNNEYEQEADRIAEQVMRMPEPGIQRKPG